LLGVIFLNIYIRENYTGPPIALPKHPFHFDTDLQSEAIELVSEGEDTFDMLSYPHYLLCAKTFFSREDIDLDVSLFYTNSHNRVIPGGKLDMQLFIKEFWSTLQNDSKNSQKILTRNCPSTNHQTYFWVN
jgi:hypothetical protein